MPHVKVEVVDEFLVELKEVVIKENEKLKQKDGEITEENEMH
jgi:hypothetical protein